MADLITRIEKILLSLKNEERYYPFQKHTRIIHLRRWIFLRSKRENEKCLVSSQNASRERDETKTKRFQKIRATKHDGRTKKIRSERTRNKISNKIITSVI